MANRDLSGADARTDRLSHIERLLEEYQATKDRELLRRAIELWDQAKAEYQLRGQVNRTRIH